MTLTELYEKRAFLGKSAREIIDNADKEKRNLSSEEQEKIDKIFADVDALKADIDKREKVSAMETETRDGFSGYEQPETPEELNDDEKRNAFVKYLQQGTSALDRMEIRGIAATTDAAGGYWAPESWQNDIVTAVTEYNALRNYATVIPTKTSTHNIPLCTTAVSASWGGEFSAFSNTAPTASTVALGAHKMYVLVKVTDEMMEDGVIDLENYMVDQMSVAIAAGEEEGILTGSGSGQPTGLNSNTAAAGSGVSNAVTTASNSAFTADEVMDLHYSVSPTYRKNGIWVMNDSTVKEVRQLKAESATYHYAFEFATKAGEVDSLFGKPIVVCSSMPSIAHGKLPIIFGDFKRGLYIADRTPIAIKRLNELYAGNGAVGFLAWKRMDSKLVDTNAIKGLRIKTGA